VARSGPVVTAQAREQIGTITRRYVSEPLSLRHVREYVAGTGGDPTAWSERDDTGEYRQVPPLFFHAACRPVVAETQLLPDGQYTFLGVEGVSGETLAGGNKYELIAPVRIGDVLTATEVLVDIVERVGRSGPLAITTTETEYTNQHGELVSRYRQTIVFR
jgi:hydroxyacyl-ACP dehydratase HTD2-like protein with hotdog domain